MPRWSPSYVDTSPPRPNFYDHFGASFDESMQREIARREADAGLVRQEKLLDRRSSLEEGRDRANQRGQLRNILVNDGWRQEQPLVPQDVTLPPLLDGGMPNTVLHGIPMHPRSDMTPDGYLRDTQHLDDGSSWWRPLAPVHTPAARRPLAAELGANEMMTPEYLSGSAKLRAGHVNQLTTEEIASLRRAGISPNTIAGVTMSEPVRRGTPQAVAPPHAPVVSDLTTLQARARAAHDLVTTFENQFLSGFRTPTARSRWLTQNPDKAALYQGYIDAANKASDDVLNYGEDPNAAPQF